MKPKGSWQYLLVDVDGTLLNSSGRIPPRNRAVLARAVAAGLTLVLATGRTYPSLLRVTDGLQLPFHLITNGGAVGLSPDLAAERHVGYMSRELWPRIVGALQAEGLSTVVYRHRHPAPPSLCIAAERGDPHFEAYMGRNEQFMELVPDLAAAGFCDVIEVAALGSGDAFEAASERVRKRFDHQAEHHTMVLFIASRFGRITEFFCPGTSKWHAFLAMFPQAAAHPERVIAIGDEANDREMLAAAGLGIAMGNAPPELKALADLVTEDHDHDGLARALEPILGAMKGDSEQASADLGG